jgi:hypothetical protein
MLEGLPVRIFQLKTVRDAGDISAEEQAKARKPEYR